MGERWEAGRQIDGQSQKVKQREKDTRTDRQSQRVRQRAGDKIITSFSNDFLTLNLIVPDDFCLWK